MIQDECRDSLLRDWCELVNDSETLEKKHMNSNFIIVVGTILPLIYKIIYL